MKNKDKYYLKALLLASISSIGMPIAICTSNSHELVEAALSNNGVLDINRAISFVINELRNGKLGKICLDE